MLHQYKFIARRYQRRDGWFALRHIGTQRLLFGEVGCMIFIIAVEF